MKKGVNRGGSNKHPLNQLYRNMYTRCYNPNNQAYKHYGGRGIKICDEWMRQGDGFIRFVEHVMSLDNAKEEGYSLDRIDNNGDYEPGNVRWADSFVQTSNRRNSNEIVGVSYEEKHRRYKAYLNLNGKRYQSHFKTKDKAIAFRKQLEAKYMKGVVNA